MKNFLRWSGRGSLSGDVEEGFEVVEGLGQENIKERVVQVQVPTEPMTSG